MNRWTASRVRKVRAQVEVFGLRIVCLLCGIEARHFGGGPRLRDRTCERCGARGSLRSRYWVHRHPDLAKVAADTLRQVQRALS